MVDAIDILVGAYNILKILEEAGLILVLGFGFHQRNLFNLTLEDQKSVVLKVDAFGTEKLANILERNFLTIDAIGGLTLAIDCTRDFKLGPGDNFIVVWLIFIIIDVLEIDSNCGVCAIFVLSRVMNQLREFVESHALSTFSKYK